MYSCLHNEKMIKKGTVIFVNSDKIGHGDEKLGEVLIKTFFYTLTETDTKPETIIFMNNGVKIPVENLEVITHLKKLEEDGVKLLICGTCLDYFKIKDQVKVGIVSNMYEIVENFLSAENVITI